MARYEDRQFLRSIGWRGAKAKRGPRHYRRTDFLPQVMVDEQTANLLAARQATTTTQE